MTLTPPKQLWFQKMIDGFNTIVRKYDLPEDIAGEFLGYLIETAKQQFKAGNSSGIAWARKNPPKSAMAMG